jgi:hypothetical protein
VTEARFLLVGGRVDGFGGFVPPWPRQDRPYVGTVRPDGRWIAWRMLAPNHRELARSALVFGDDDECLGAITGMLAGDGDVALEPGPVGMWAWRYDAGGEPVAVSGRLYHRQRECSYNAESFYDAIHAHVTAPDQALRITRGRRG